MASAERDRSLDLLSGIFVTYMIYTHICETANLTDTWHYVTLNSFLYFFMPWFFFKSGMFHRYRTDYGLSLTKLRKRLVIPLLVFSIAAIPMFSIYYVLDYGGPYWMNFLYSFFYSLIEKSAPFGNYPLWYLLALIFIKLILMVIRSNKLILIIAIIGVLSSFLLWYYNISFIFIVTEVFLGMFFYATGYFLKNIQYKKYVLPISFLLFISLAVFYPVHISVRSNDVYGGGYFVGIISSLLGIISFNCISKSIMAFNLISKSKVVSFVLLLGEDSMYYYVIHWIYLISLKIVLIFFHMDLTLLFALLPLTLLVSKKFHILDKYTKAL